MTSIIEFRKKFRTKTECAKFLGVSLEQLARYYKCRAIILDNRVYCPAIKKQKRD